MQLLNQKGTVNVMEEYRMPTDVQFKTRSKKESDRKSQTSKQAFRIDANK